MSGPVLLPRPPRRAGAPARRAARRAAAVVAALALAVPFPPRDAQAIEAFAKGPYLQELGPNGVTVRFELAASSAATVDVTPDDAKAGAPATASAKGASSSFHSLRLGGLEPGRRYRYVARAGGASQSGAFTTAPDEAKAPPFAFLVYGDNRSDEVSHAAVVRAMEAAPGDFFVNTGDYVQNGSSPEDWQSFFTIERSLLRNRTLFGCIGNHELLEQSGAAYLRYLGPSVIPAAAGGGATGPAPSSPPLEMIPRLDAGVAAQAAPLAPPSPHTSVPPTPRARLFWTFRWSSVRFFMLNAFDTWVSGEEREWLASELSKSKNEPGLTWRIAVLHQGPWSAGPHGNNLRFLSAGVNDMLAQAGIDLVLSGHDHIYERGFAKGLRYVVSGGGGAPLYRVSAKLPSTRKVEPTYHFIEAKVTGEAIKLATRRVDGSLIEECGFTKGTTWDCDPAAAAPAAPLRESSGSPAAPGAGASKCGCRVAGEGGSPLAANLGGVAAVAAVAAVARRVRGGRRGHAPRRG